MAWVSDAKPFNRGDAGGLFVLARDVSARPTRYRLLLLTEDICSALLCAAAVAAAVSAAVSAALLLTSRPFPFLSCSCCARCSPTSWSWPTTRRSGCAQSLLLLITHFLK